MLQSEAWSQNAPAFCAHQDKVKLINLWNLLFIKNRQICLASNWILKRAKRKAHICQKIVVWSSRLTCQSVRSISIRYQQQQLRHLEQNWLNFAILKRLAASGRFANSVEFSDKGIFRWLKAELGRQSVSPFITSCVCYSSQLFAFLSRDRLITNTNILLG